MGHELDSLDVPKADLHNKDANTIRSYTHEGEFEDYLFMLINPSRAWSLFKEN